MHRPWPLYGQQKKTLMLINILCCSAFSTQAYSADEEWKFTSKMHI